MKFCPECGVKLISQKFCHECGCNISTYLNGGESESTNSFSSGFDSFDFSALQNAASQQLNEQKETESFYKNAEINGTVLVKYNGSDENAVIPEGITEIKNSAFYSAKVKSIRVPSTVTKIEDIGLYCSNAESYEVDANNKYFKSIDGVVYSKDGRVLVQFPNGRSGYYNMPNEVESVKRSSISGCVKLTGLTLSNRLTKIDDFMFCGTAFSTLSIPSSVTSIGINAFEMCNNLSSITIPGNVTTIGDNAFSCCGNLRSVTISEGVVSMGNYAFFNCTYLSSVTLPSSLNVIGAYAFQQCRALSSITIPRGVATVRAGAFAYCESLSNVTIEEGVRAIEAEAFNNYCLKSVKIPRSVQSISNSAFPTSLGLYGGGFKMYVPRGRRYGLDTYGREFIDY
ncbi:MAG: leucine-rich repeat domain-containing protein [Clostridia bacterium]|nr:leucine-rich repeat domain-containing protein [Clostridia bacterium]